MANSTTPLQILMVEDSESDVELNAYFLSKAGHKIAYRQVFTSTTLRDAIHAQSWDIILMDFNIPSLDAFQALQILQEAQSKIPVIILSGLIQDEIAQKLMEAGVIACLRKGEYKDLLPHIETIAEKRRTFHHGSSKS